MALIGVDFVEIIEKLDFWRCCATVTDVIDGKNKNSCHSPFIKRNPANAGFFLVKPSSQKRFCKPWLHSMFSCLFIRISQRNDFPFAISTTKER